MIAVLSSLVALTLWSIAATIVVVARDGYRTVPTRL